PRRSRPGGCMTPSSARTSASGPSTTGTPTAGGPSPPRWPSATCSCSPSGRSSTTSGPGASNWRRPWTPKSQPSPPLPTFASGGWPDDDGVNRPVVSFASNDYLGLTQHPAVIAAAPAALDRWGAGSGAARLIVGSRPVHSELERELAAWKQSQRALLFPTGF